MLATIKTVIAIAVIALAAAACGNDTTDADRYGAGRSAGSVAITQPLDGAVVTGPVEVQMAADAFVIEPAGAVRSGAGHFHLMIDVPCVAPGSVIPADDAHRHYGDASTTATLDLAPGEHTLCLQVGDGVHTALDLTATVTFTVAG